MELKQLTFVLLPNRTLHFSFYSINTRYVIWNNLFLSGQCSHEGAAEAAFVCVASLCAAELQACSGLRGQGERTMSDVRLPDS